MTGIVPATGGGITGMLPVAGGRITPVSGNGRTAPPSVNGFSLRGAAPAELPGVGGTVIEPPLAGGFTTSGTGCAMAPPVINSSAAPAPAHTHQATGSTL